MRLMNDQILQQNDRTELGQPYEVNHPADCSPGYVCTTHRCCVLGIFAVDANFIVVFLAVQLEEGNESHNEQTEAEEGIMHDFECID